MCQSRILHQIPEPLHVGFHQQSTNCGRVLIGPACKTLATGAKYESIVKPSIKAAHSLRDSYASRLFRPSVSPSSAFLMTLISSTVA
ncbi:hypothetical protein, partial [Microcoleus sp. herbarium12]|uniref:hypothetical protein n=1 Tax=Microcoleus sp. herbarium12 TaxID=3055437 RepID=UPI002FD0ACC8